MRPLNEYEFASRESTPENILLLISELEGSYQNLKYMGFEDDMAVIEEMKKRYHKMYFKKSK